MRARHKGHKAVAAVVSLPFQAVVATISETIAVWGYLTRRIEVTPALCDLLAAIRRHEAPEGYGQVYSGSRIKGNVSAMTLDEVLAFQERMVRNRSRSSAAGAYQFLRKTLRATVAEMGLDGSEVWTPALQDRMAIYLMQKRGLGEYLDGYISEAAFADNLAREWASLPVVTGPRRGRSFYHGDGLNKAHHTPDDVLRLVTALKAPPKHTHH